MKLDRKLISKALCMSAICCALLTNVVYAEEKNCEKTTQSASISVNTPETFYEFIEKKNVYSSAKNPFAEKKYLNKAKEIADKFPNDKDIQRNYYENLSYFYADYGNSYASVKELENALKYLDTNNLDASVFLYNQLARYYTEINEYEKADLMLKKKAKILKNKQIQNIDDQKIEDYATRMYFYQLQGKLGLSLPLYKEGKKIIDENSLGNTHIYSRLNEPLIWYYLCIRDVDNAQKAIDVHYNISKETKDSGLKSFTLEQYVHLYGIQQEEAKARKALKGLITTSKKMYNDDSIGILDATNYKIDYYQRIGKIENAEKYATKNVELAEQYKEITPIVYAKTLKKLAEVKLQSNKIGEALSAIKLAKNYYLVELPENSLPIYETEKLIGDIYMSIGDIEQGLKHYKTAKDTLDKGKFTPFTYHIDIYKSIANAYLQKGDTENAITEINKALNIAKSIFGEDHIITLWIQLDKAYIYKDSAQCVLAKNQIDNILNKVKAEKVSDPFDIEFQCYMFLANSNFEKGNYDDALANATQALQNPFSDSNKDCADALISQIYKAQDKKLKSLKHKIKSKI